MPKDVAEQKEYGFSTKFQQFINEEKWQEVKAFVADYVIGGDNSNIELKNE